MINKFIRRCILRLDRLSEGTVRGGERVDFPECPDTVMVFSCYNDIYTYVPLTLAALGGEALIHRGQGSVCRARPFRKLT